MTLAQNEGEVDDGEWRNLGLAGCETLRHPNRKGESAVVIACSRLMP